MTKFFYSDIYLESSFSDYIIVEFKKKIKKIRETWLAKDYSRLLFLN